MNSRRLTDPSHTIMLRSDYQIISSRALGNCCAAMSEDQRRLKWVTL